MKNTYKHHHFLKKCLAVTLWPKLSMVIVSLLILQACGQTGPLYLPHEQPPIHVPEESE